MPVIADAFAPQKPSLWKLLKRGKNPIVVVPPLTTRPGPIYPEEGLFGIGADSDGLSPTLWTPAPVVRTIYSLLSLTGAVLGAYHGYKRNDDSLGWAIGWGLLGGAFPVITLPVSYAQGFGEVKKAKK
jgi:hypothetical protein